MPILQYVSAGLTLSTLVHGAGLNVQVRADAAQTPTSINYGRPFEPPTRPAFIPLPPGTVEPTGWLQGWAITARDGYIGHMWMATCDNGLPFTHYGPCKISALVADRVPVEIECRTDYPFRESLNTTVKRARATVFPLSFRMPGWCSRPRLTVNGSAFAGTPNASGFVSIERAWKSGDTVTLLFPMTPSVKTGRDNNAEDTPYATVSCGPLLFVLGIPDTADPNTPVPYAKWNYALDVRGRAPAFDVAVERRPMPEK